MKPITAEEIVAINASGTPIICFDVREGARHFALDAGGWHLPFNQVTQNAPKLLPYKDSIAVVCCMRPSGSGRTAKAARALKALGFQDVRELAGGIFNGWVKKMKRAKMPGEPDTGNPITVQRKKATAQ